MPPSIRFRCPTCSARIKAPFQLLGKTRDCPRCGNLLHIQMKAPEDSEPLLSSDEALPSNSARGLDWF
jgi:uncharacterized paraquat-inducible protein A